MKSRLDLPPLDIDMRDEPSIFDFFHIVWDQIGDYGPLLLKIYSCVIVVLLVVGYKLWSGLT